MEHSVVYITCRDSGEAERIGKALVGKRLAACANIIPGMRSIFWWKGKLNKEEESILLLKTRESLVKRITEEVKKIHSYSNPCIISLPISQGSPEYLEWIEKGTG